MKITNHTSSAHRTLHPIHVFPVNRMLQSWAESWNEHDEPTEDWRLVAWPFLADGSIALLFEFRNEIYDGNIDRMYPARISSFYKVYIYDPHSGKLLKRHRFRLQDGFCYTVFFYDGNLYGVVKPWASQKYDVIRMWPGKCDHDQFKIGKNVTRVVSDREGNVYVGYECKAHSEENGVTPIICYAEHNNWKLPIKSEFPVTRCQDLTLDAKDRFWYHLYPDNRLQRLEDGYSVAYTVEISGFAGFGFSQSGDYLLTEFDYKDDEGCRLFAMRRDKAAYIDPVPVKVEGIGKFIPGCGSYLGTNAAYYCGEAVYVVDLNELE
ncbi:MAG: hypothetical protein E7211_18575 [Clostridium lundense]|nr:hypothetical protein [Clostridium lundense]